MASCSRWSATQDPSVFVFCGSCKYIYKEPRNKHWKAQCPCRSSEIFYGMRGTLHITGSRYGIVMYFAWFIVEFQEFDDTDLSILLPGLGSGAKLGLCIHG